MTDDLIVTNPLARCMNHIHKESVCPIEPVTSRDRVKERAGRVETGDSGQTPVQIGPDITGHLSPKTSTYNLKKKQNERNLRSFHK